MLIMKVEKRIQDYIDFLDKIKYKTVQPLSWQFVKEDRTRRTPPEDLKWSDITMPHPYGEEFTSFWFRTELNIPESAKEKDLFLYAQPQSDSLVFLNGVPQGALNLHHERIRISKDSNPGQKIKIHIESYGGHYYPGCHTTEGKQVVLTIGKTIPDYPNMFLNGELQVKIDSIYNLYYDLRALFETASILSKDSLRKANILKVLFDALILIPMMGDDKEIEESCVLASKKIQHLLQNKNSETCPEVFLAGHAHIDHAWLWPIAETEKKIARTFSNMCGYADEFPDFIFLQSHPAQLESVKQNYPDVFNQIKAVYDRGQWEPNGGMWVEADCNIPSGESFIRQFLYGRKVTRELLDYTGDTLWLPDVFGYASSLPQIIKGCGIKYFVTSKINWNDTTRFPYDKFHWEGIDGTSVETLFIPDCEGGYNGSATPKNLNDSWKNIQHKEVQNSYIKSIGEGDGGGGTHRSDLELAARLHDLEGNPRVKWQKISDSLNTIFNNSEDLPYWKGELYLELHRGTYTSQANTKKYNRKIELQLSRVELLYVLSNLKGEELIELPRNQVDAIWKQLLTLQFHDIIPGSSIRRVYEDAERDYAQMQIDLSKLESTGVNNLTNKESDNSLTVFNHLGLSRNGLISIENSREGLSIYKGKTEISNLQSDRGLDGKDRWVVNAEVDALGWNSFTISESKKDYSSPFKLVENTLETPYFAMDLTSDGGISTLKYHNHFFNFVADKKELNTFILAEDTPLFWDAWDIDADYRMKEKRGTKLLNREVVSQGSTLIRIRFNYSLGKDSIIEQDMVCYAYSPRIDFETRVVWHERRTLLKVSFPLAIESNEAAGEVQFGHIVRPTHENRPEDRARFEVCAHKWMASSDGKQSAAVLNDCKYGWDVKGSNIRLTLLKAPEAPDEIADYGIHEFTYSFLPSTSGLSVPYINRAAAGLNQPLLTYQGSAYSSDFSLANSSNSGVIIETVKQSEENSAVILRLYEAEGAKQQVTINFGLPVENIKLTTMLEDDIEELEIDNNSLSLSLHKFEIVTVKVVFNTNMPLS